jgi:hypothetical protein
VAEDQNGNTYFIDAKHGNRAGLTRNQRAAYDLIREEGGYPVGVKAREAGLPYEIGPTPILIDPW